MYVCHGEIRECETLTPVTKGISLMPRLLLGADGANFDNLSLCGTDSSGKCRPVIFAVT